MKKCMTFLVITVCFSVYIQAQTVVVDGKKVTTKSSTLDTQSDSIIGTQTNGTTISLDDYKNLNVLWNDYFASVMSPDTSLTIDASLYQKELLRCLKDPSAHSSMQPQALGEVLFYKYFAKKTPLVTITDNIELTAEIYDFLSFVYSPEAMVENISERLVIGNFFSFLASTKPNITLGLGSGLNSFIQGIAPNFNSLDDFKIENEYEQVELYRAINKLNKLQNKQIQRNTWIEIINDPVVWYLLQNCRDYSVLKEKWDIAGFGQKELEKLDKVYLSDRARSVYHIQELIKELNRQDPLLGISTDQLLSKHAQNALNLVKQDEFVLNFFSAADAKELDTELTTYQLSLNLWLSRINALAFIKGESNGSE
jgi:hypothetical protein